LKNGYEPLQREGVFSIGMGACYSVEVKEKIKIFTVFLTQLTFKKSMEFYE
jgi:hypothetical protein